MSCFHKHVILDIRYTRNKIKALEIHKKTGCKIDIIAEMLNLMIRGWMNDFGKFNLSVTKYTLRCIERRLVKLGNV